MQQMGDVIAELGKVGERAVLQCSPRLGWWVSVRPGSSEDDHHGIDAYAVTRWGEFPFQIKTAKRRVREFRKRNTGIPVILVRRLDTTETLSEKIRGLARRKLKKRYKVRFANNGEPMLAPVWEPNQ